MNTNNWLKSNIIYNRRCIAQIIKYYYNYATIQFS